MKYAATGALVRATNNLTNLNLLRLIKLWSWISEKVWFSMSDHHHSVYNMSSLENCILNHKTVIKWLHFPKLAVIKNISSKILVMKQLKYTICCVGVDFGYCVMYDIVYDWNLWCWIGLVIKSEVQLL